MGSQLPKYMIRLPHCSACKKELKELKLYTRTDSTYHVKGGRWLLKSQEFQTSFKKLLQMEGYVITSIVPGSKRKIRKSIKLIEYTCCANCGDVLSTEKIEALFRYSSYHATLKKLTK